MGLHTFKGGQCHWVETLTGGSAHSQATEHLPPVESPRHVTWPQNGQPVELQSKERDDPVWEVGTAGPETGSRTGGRFRQRPRLNARICERAPTAVIGPPSSTDLPELTN